MLFSELYKIMVNKVTFVGFRGRSPQSPLRINPCFVPVAVEHWLCDALYVSPTIAYLVSMVGLRSRHGGPKPHSPWILR